MARFDDRLKNLLALARDKSPANRIALFSHLSDMLLQGLPLGDAPERAVLLDILQQLRTEVPQRIRKDVADTLLLHRQPPYELVRLLACDELYVARPILDHVRLSENQWLDLVPDLSAAHRAHLRIRLDLPPAVRRALKEKPAEAPLLTERKPGRIRHLLDQLADIAAEHPAPRARAEEIAARPGAVIPESVRFKGRRPAPRPPETPRRAGIAAALFATPRETPPAAPKAQRPPIPQAAESEAKAPPETKAPPTMASAKPAPEPVEVKRIIDPNPVGPAAIFDMSAIRPQVIEAAGPIPAGVDWIWETDRLGQMTLIGADPGCFLDEDGDQLIGSFLVDLFTGDDEALKRLENFMIGRRPYRDLGLTAKESLGGAKWRLSAVPHFDAASGTFVGYRGTARIESFLDSLRDTKLIPTPRREAPLTIDPAHWAHEMRTPLNAIKGFAEMIEGEVWGHVPEVYRDRSLRIREAVIKADQVVSDLLSLARMDSGNLALDLHSCDLGDLVHKASVALFEEDRTLLDLRKAEPVPAALADADQTATVVGKILRTAKRWTPKGQPIEARLGPAPDGGVLLRIAVPNWKDGWHEDALSHISAARESELLMQERPALSGLGLDFAARLVREMRGKLEIRPDSTRQPQIVLYLPGSPA